MAERKPYVTQRRSSGRAGALAALAGALVALAALGGIAYAFAGGFLTSGDEAAPATTSAPTSTVPRKPVLRIVFPEGFTRAEMAQRIAAVNRIAKRKRNITPKLSPRAYLRASQRARLPDDFRNADVPHLEGFLFPATYEFTADTASRVLVRNQLAAFERAWDEIDLRYARSKNLTPYDVLIIASMIEEEVLVPRERALVAAVIYNRLRLGMPLGIDATIRYGLGVPNTESLRQSQLADPTPYNTRIHTGLPPTPITNPGLAAMQAAARPANVDYLFFVRKPDCKSHYFTADEDEFYARLAGPRC
ncbi:MAG: endolytic transglycosylase MltG [Actinomycetota bacterium]|nr:endolytic transglycosylase MltG [Actinomycetota bacterium]